MLTETFIIAMKKHGSNYRPVGERFNFYGTELQVAAFGGCQGCYFYDKEHHQHDGTNLRLCRGLTRIDRFYLGPCSAHFRADNESVIFKQVKE